MSGLDILEEIAKACDGYLEEDKAICESNCCFEVTDLNCVVLNTDDCLPFNSSCEFTVFIKRNSSLDVVLIEMKDEEQDIEVLEPKFRFSDALVLMILSSICNLDAVNCRFLFVQLSFSPRTSPEFVIKKKNCRKWMRFPGGKFMVIPVSCGVKLSDLLKKHPPRNRSRATATEHLNNCRC